MIYSFHVFSRSGSILFSKNYAAVASLDPEEDESRSKLTFGMLFSLKEICAQLAPIDPNGVSETSEPPQKIAALECIRTGDKALHCHETLTGLRFVVYTDVTITNLQGNLCSIYNIWVETVTKSPLFISSANNIGDTNFERKLDEYLEKLSAFR